MADQRNIKPTVFESITGDSIGTFTINVPKNILADGHFPFLFADVIIKQGSNVVPGSAYTLHKDTEASDQESLASSSTVVLYGAITITNATYAGVELNISGKNYGAYGSNDGVVSYIAEQLLTKSGPGSDNFIEEGEPAIFDSASGTGLVSDNSGEIAAWDSGPVYGTAGTLLRKEGITATATGQAANQNKDPLDQNNSLYWYLPDDEDVLLRQANKGKPISSDMHVIHDRSHANYQQNIKVGKKKVSGVQKEFFEIMLDGTQVTGNATLEAILAVGLADEYPYLDIYAPDVLGTRTLLDMGEHISTPMSSGGENDTLGEVLEDGFQGFDRKVVLESFLSDGMTTAGVTAGAAGPFPGWSANSSLEALRQTDYKTDGTYGTPRPGNTTRPKELTEGISYIVVMVAA